jgi:hypothetical protein
VLAVDPKVLLAFGDPALLPTDIRATMLRDFARRYASQKHTSLSVGRREVRRLADPRLVPTVRALLEERREHDDVRKLLLRVVREGKLQGLGELMLSFATDNRMDRYSRISAVQAIGAGGTDDEKRRLKAALLAKDAISDRSLFGAVLGALFPTHLSVEELPLLLESLPKRREGHTDILESELVHVVEQTSDTQALRLLAGLVVLLKRAPLRAEEWCRISTEYAWLLPVAMATAKRLIAGQPNGPFDPAILATIAMARQADHLGFYVGRVGKEAEELLGGNAVLKHAVFWHFAEEGRAARPSERLVDYWVVAPMSSQHLQFFGDVDVPLFLDALRVRPLMDDRLIALTALVSICVRTGHPPDLLERITTGVAGVPELEATAQKQLNPQPSAAMEAYAEREQERQRGWEEEKAREAEERQKAVTWIKANAGTLEIGDYAKEGKIIGNIRWLHQEVAEKTSSGSRWSVSGWRKLEPEFGSEVAKAFRDHCVAYWRLYRPQLRSEIGAGTNSTPWSVIVGLSGLAMEAADDKSWAEKVNPEEAERATRYALRELNQLPGWFADLFAAHPDTMTAVLLGEIRWEMEAPRSKNEGGYILSRLQWSARDLGQALRADILGLLEQYPVADEKTLAEALAVVLRNPEPIPASFLEVIAQRISRASSDELKSAWVAALLCLDAKRAVTALENWVDQAADAKTSEYRISKVLEYVWGDSFHGVGSVHTSYREAKLLLRLMKLTYAHVKLADDIRHEGAYSPGLRDRAQDARGHILKLLCDLGGRDSYDGLLELSEFHPEEYPRDRMRILAEQRAEADAEHAAWITDEVDAFAATAERGPRTQRDLFDIALYRLDDLKFDLEEGDESEASLLRRVVEEPELRRVIANRLRYSAAGKYTTGSEEELKDKTRTDIRLHHPAVEARIPIELKIADARHWTAAKLRERLENQLIGQYMDEARYGIFLIVRRGAKRDRAVWHLGDGAQDRELSFQELADWLEEEAEELLRGNPTIDGLKVVAIDLTKSASDQPNGTKKPAKPRRGYSSGSGTGRK